jgi:Na+-transporting NADH:ubiquinone oxidoreductase subunit NqrC
MKWNSEIDPDLIGPIVGIITTLLLLGFRFGIAGEAVVVILVATVIASVLIGSAVISFMRSLKEEKESEKIVTIKKTQVLGQDGMWHTIGSSPANSNCTVKTVTIKTGGKTVKITTKSPQEVDSEKEDKLAEITQAIKPKTAEELSKLQAAKHSSTVVQKVLHNIP